MIVAGLGFRHAVEITVLQAVLDVALDECRIARASLRALATPGDKADHPALRDLARRMGLPVIAIAAADMQRVAHLSLTSSARVAALRGVPSVAETCALAAAGNASRLLCARVANATATCAIAEGEAA